MSGCAERNESETARARATCGHLAPCMALEQAVSRHDEDDLERLRLTAAREGSVPWFEARWRLALFVSGNKVELPLLVLVVINSAVVGLQTYRKFGDAINAALVISQHVCTAIFAAEVLLKLVAFGPKLYFTNVWNVFDSLIVALSFSDKAFFSVFRIARAFRIIRPFRKVISGLVKSFPSLMWVLLLILLVIYMFAVLGVLVFRDGPYGVFFASIGDAMFTLLQVTALETWSGSCDATLEDCVDGIARPMIARYPGAWLYFVLYAMATAYCLVLLGDSILIDTLLRTRQQEADQAKKLADKLAKHRLLSRSRGAPKRPPFLGGEIMKRLFKARGTMPEQPLVVPPPSSDAAEVSPSRADDTAPRSEDKACPPTELKQQQRRAARDPDARYEGIPLRPLYDELDAQFEESTAVRRSVASLSAGIASMHARRDELEVRMTCPQMRGWGGAGRGGAARLNSMVLLPCAHANRRRSTRTSRATTPGWTQSAAP